MKLYKFIFLVMFIFFFSCEDQQIKEENTQLKEQVSELKSMMSRMRASDDKLMFLSSKLSGIKGRIKTNMGDIEIKFYPEHAPIQCFNFITRAESGFYDNTQFHRVIAGFMIQGGDPNTKTDDKSSYGSGGPVAMIPHEFSNVPHKRGILSTARIGDENAGAGSQFFIMHADNHGLDNKYTVFGEVTDGMDVVDKIATTKTVKDLPVSAVRIHTIEIYR